MTDFSKVNWIIDELLQERQYECGFPSLAEAAKSIGCNVYQTKYIPFSEQPDPNIPFHINDCVVSHGSVEFIQQISNSCLYEHPGEYFSRNTKMFSVFATYYGDLMFNDSWVLITYGEFVRRGLAEGESIFIKPNNGMKEFPGKVVYWDTFEEFVDSTKRIKPILSSTLCVAAPVRPIKAEFRYVIADGKVVTGSQYRYANKLDVRIDTMPQADELVRKVAEFEWQPEPVYVCDIGIDDEDNAKIIELNVFSSSGLYACDTVAIAEAVSQAAYKQYRKDYGLVKEYTL